MARAPMAGQAQTVLGSIAGIPFLIERGHLHPLFMSLDIA
jgi:hypothetical protein